MGREKAVSKYYSGRASQVRWYLNRNTKQRKTDRQLSGGKSIQLGHSQTELQGQQQARCQCGQSRVDEGRGGGDGGSDGTWKHLTRSEIRILLSINWHEARIESG